GKGQPQGQCTNHFREYRGSIEGGENGFIRLSKTKTPDRDKARPVAPGGELQLKLILALLAYLCQGGNCRGHALRSRNQIIHRGGAETQQRRQNLCSKIARYGGKPENRRGRFLVKKLRKLKRMAC